MDASSAGQSQTEQKFGVAPATGSPVPPPEKGRYPSPAAGAMLAPRGEASPLKYGLMMGGATALSVGISCCCLLSVAGYLHPNRRILNSSILCASIVAGIYVGIRCWQTRRAPRPISNGRCPDCGREITMGQTICSLCGRPVQ